MDEAQRLARGLLDGAAGGQPGRGECPVLQGVDSLVVENARRLPGHHADVLRPAMLTDVEGQSDLAVDLLLQRPLRIPGHHRQGDRRVLESRQYVELIFLHLCLENLFQGVGHSRALSVPSRVLSPGICRQDRGGKRDQNSRHGHDRPLDDYAVILKPLFYCDRQVSPRFSEMPSRCWRRQRNAPGRADSEPAAAPGAIWT